MTTESPAIEPVLSLTAAARTAVLEARSGEDNPERLGLFIEVGGDQDGVYAYEMWFQAIIDAASGDVVQRHDDLTVVVVGESVDKLMGATLDSSDAGLVMLNPNTPPRDTPRLSVSGSDLSSPLEQAVLRILEEEINPQIAAHGGRADLLSVDDAGVAYLVLSGGCQGCGMAHVTLTEGITVAIRDGVPGITNVIDATAHAEGTDPFFSGAHAH